MRTINAKTFRFSFLAGLLAFCLDMILSGQARKEHGLDNFFSCLVVRLRACLDHFSGRVAP